MDCFGCLLWCFKGLVKPKPGGGHRPTGRRCGVARDFLRCSKDYFAQRMLTGRGPAVWDDDPKATPVMIVKSLDLSKRQRVQKVLIPIPKPSHQVLKPSVSNAPRTRKLEARKAAREPLHLGQESFLGLQAAWQRQGEAEAARQKQAKPTQMQEDHLHSWRFHSGVREPNAAKAMGELEAKAAKALSDAAIPRNKLDEARNAATEPVRLGQEFFLAQRTPAMEESRNVLKSRGEYVTPNIQARQLGANGLPLPTLLAGGRPSAKRIFYAGCITRPMCV